MLGSIGRPVSAARVLRQQERRVKVLRDVMSSLHDLEGAVEARQSGLIAWSLQNLVLHSVLHRVVCSGYDLPDYDRVEQEWYDAILTVERLDPELAGRTRDLYANAGSAHAADPQSAVLTLVSQLVYDGQPADSAHARDHWLRELTGLKNEISELSRTSTKSKRGRT